MSDPKFTINDITADDIKKWNAATDAFIPDSQVVVFKDGQLTSAQKINQNLKLFQTLANIIQNKLPDWVSEVLSSDEARDGVTKALEIVFADDTVMAKVTALFLANDLFKQELAKLIENNETFQEVLEKFFEDDEALLKSLTQSLFKVFVSSDEFMDAIAYNTNLQADLKTLITQDASFKMVLTSDVEKAILKDTDFFTKLATNFDLIKIFSDEFVKNLDKTLKASFEALANDVTITKLNNQSVVSAFEKVSDKILDINDLMEREIVVFADDNVPDLWQKLTLTSPGTGYSFYKYNKNIKKLVDIIKTLSLGTLDTQTPAGVLALTNTKNSLSLTDSDVNVVVNQKAKSNEKGNATISAKDLAKYFGSVNVNWEHLVKKLSDIIKTLSLGTLDTQTPAGVLALTNTKNSLSLTDSDVNVVVNQTVGFKTPTSIFTASKEIISLCAYNNKLYIGCSDNKLYEYTGSGTPTSIFTADNWIKALCVYNDKLYLGCNDNKLYQYTGSGTPTSIFTAGDEINALCVYNDKLYFGCSDNKLYEYTGSGTPTSIGTAGDEINALCAYNNKLYLGCQDSKLYEYTGSGTPTSIGTAGDVINALCVYNDKLYFGCYDKKLYEYTGSGTPTSIFTAGNAIISLCAYNNKLYLGCSDNKLYQYTGSGTPTSIFTAGNTISALCVYIDKLYLGCYDNKLYEATDTLTGKATISAKDTDDYEGSVDVTWT